ncbi:MAG: RNA polymerase sigma factor [Planctomycetota bacterium]
MPTTAIMIDALITMRHEPGGIPEDHFWQLVERFRADLVNQAFVILGNQADAEDVAQLTLAKAFRKLNTLRDPQKLGSWMRAINHRIALNHLRSRKRSRVRANGEIDTSFVAPATTPTGSDLEAVSRSVTIEQVAHAVDLLPDLYREVVVLRYWEHLDIEQIAARLSISSGAVKSRQARADRMLLESLQRIWNQE